MAGKQDDCCRARRRCSYSPCASALCEFTSARSARGSKARRAGGTDTGSAIAVTRQPTHFRGARRRPGAVLRSRWSSESTTGTSAAFCGPCWWQKGCAIAVLLLVSITHCVRHQAAAPTVAWVARREHHAALPLPAVAEDVRPRSRSSAPLPPAPSLASCAGGAEPQIA